jgi:hypothetical protein
MNPFMRWTDGGKTFVCCFCGASTPCPEHYFNYLGPDGRCAWDDDVDTATMLCVCLRVADLE